MRFCFCFANRDLITLIYSRELRDLVLLFILVRLTQFWKQQSRVVARPQEHSRCSVENNFSRKSLYPIHISRKIILKNRGSRTNHVSRRVTWPFHISRTKKCRFTSHENTLCHAGPVIFLRTLQHSIWTLLLQLFPYESFLPFQYRIASVRLKTNQTVSI